jgi:hypothetical protein
MEEAQAQYEEGLAELQEAWDAAVENGGNAGTLMEERDGILLRVW